MKPSRPARRPGFTLIELLMVIAIIAILSMATFGLFRAASSARNKSRSKGDIQAISMACENYKKNYGDYPCRTNGGTDDNFRKDLFDQLVGRRLIKGFPLTTGTAVELIAYNDGRLPSGSGGRKQKSFITVGEIKTNDDANFGSTDWTQTTEFRDAWDNAYDYRYRVLNAAGSPIQSASGIYQTPFADWKSPNFLLVSCGANYVEPATAGTMPATAEYWDATATGSSTMTKNGIIPGTYFEDAASGPFRADNLVNWTTN
jgi:prepilin-type N-terminal cleavage/methylation domain-containing protein